jgi:hypothetical protein
MEEVKFCKDCKHYKAARYVPVWGTAGFHYEDACRSPERPITPGFYVNGVAALPMPVNARKPDGFCTPQAIHWEERPPEPEPPVLMTVEEYNTLDKGGAMPTPWWKFWKKEG